MNCLRPGIISSLLAQDEMSGPNAEGDRTMITTSAAGRMGTPTDVADTAAFIMGPKVHSSPARTSSSDGGGIAVMKAAQAHG